VTVDVQARWRARRAPDGDFVMFGDGTLVVMELRRFRDPEMCEWLELARARDWEPAYWAEVDSTKASCTRDGVRAQAGESANHGSIGWVALTRLDPDDTLEWLAISQYANPFAHVELDDTTVTATSTAGYVWRFPRDAPHDVEIIRS
jgi:hypothetical protein